MYLILAFVWVCVSLLASSVSGTWTDAVPCAAPQDYQVRFSGVPAFTVSSTSLACNCAGGYETNGNISAASINAGNVLTAGSIQYPVFQSAQPASRFSSTATSGWVFTGESLTVTLSAPRRLRFSLRQMVLNNVAGNLAYAVGVSNSSSLYTRACNSPTPHDVAAPVTTTTADWYCAVPQGTWTYHVFVRVLGGGGDWSVANENTAARAQCDLRAAAN
eukprot:TRINITY_DN26585_c0_g1_i1.p2 TRINITY_DN26585_c0_g1~~TRINITY_DN26585_c0_g1_i1.p2  ORF type:complete len:218 (-),score=51.76 TRINITY_DN26585_c0_g1_i1:575-1228(-)